ncbi:PREDICTED: centromere protein X isoform X2 [Nicotiana attenuata]|uniref:centromere protein X isoform X2 n=1 Tax=Nicotiana attenuata TaxID=49451 RepID=UPI00090500A6|nr:PREDICTED: centromere protein X isoform X2 [Nicotiana attenuata]
MREHPMEKENPFDPDLVHDIFKLVWKRKAAERGKNEISENMDNEVGASSSKRSRPTFANANALKLSSEILRVFVAAIQRAATIAEAEGSIKIEATHLERILPQLLLDF